MLELLKWDIKNRPKTGVKSETLSRYSATYFDQDANNQVMGYPVALLGFLKPYIKLDSDYMSVGGNIQALLQVKKNGAKNAIGERVNTWVDCTSILGWLDLSTGDSKHTTFYAKVQESTHIFLCDFTNLKNLSTDWVWNPFSFLTGVISKTDDRKPLM